MPQWLSEAPATFNRLVMQLFHSIDNPLRALSAAFVSYKTSSSRRGEEFNYMMLGRMTPTSEISPLFSELLNSSTDNSSSSSKAPSECISSRRAVPSQIPVTLLTIVHRWTSLSCSEIRHACDPT